MKLHRCAALWGVLLSCPLLGAQLNTQDLSVKQTAKPARRLAQSKRLYWDEAADFGKSYTDWKQQLSNDIGLQYGLDASYLFQRGTPGGKQTSIQSYYYPYISWNLFHSDRWGAGQLNANYTLIRYWGISGSTLQNRLGLLSAQNDYTANEEEFNQLSYTHILPGDFHWLSVTVGQYPMYNFDGTTYLDNQQTALFNFALSQNATSTYASSGIGAYIQAAPGDWTFSAGYQDASNISGQTVRLRTAFDGKYTWFASATYAPMITGLGAGQFSLLYYWQPSVKEQEGSSRGWSVNISQDIGEKWVLSARANGSSGHITSIKQSYVLAATYVDPLNRSSSDAITLGLAYNRADAQSLSYPHPFRDYENAFELQWVWGIGKLLTLTPDVQLLPKAALGNGHKFTTVVGLRTTVML